MTKDSFPPSLSDCCPFFFKKLFFWGCFQSDEDRYSNYSVARDSFDRLAGVKFKKNPFSPLLIILKKNPGLAPIFYKEKKSTRDLDLTFIIIYF